MINKRISEPSKKNTKYNKTHGHDKTMYRYINLSSIMIHPNRFEKVNAYLYNEYAYKEFIHLNSPAPLVERDMPYFYMKSLMADSKVIVNAVPLTLPDVTRRQVPDPYHFIYHLIFISEKYQSIIWMMCPNIDSGIRYFHNLQLDAIGQNPEIFKFHGYFVPLTDPMMISPLENHIDCMNMINGCFTSEYKHVNESSTTGEDYFELIVRASNGDSTTFSII